MADNLRITHLHFGNWRNFRSVDVDLTWRAFLIGPNAAGKSNFLDAVRFLRDLVIEGGGFREAIHRRGGVALLRSLYARKTPQIGLTVQVGTSEVPDIWRYELAFTFDRRRDQPIIRRERVLGRGREILTRPTPEDQQDETRLTQTHLQQVNSNRAFRELADFFGSIRYLHIVPQLVREPDRSTGKINDPFGGDFLEQLGRVTRKTLGSRLSKIERALRIAVPQLRDLQWVRDEHGHAHLEGRYEHWRPNAGWQKEDQFSDGTLRLLGLLWALLDGTGPLLLEEPEMSLHSRLARRLPQMMARLQQTNRRQILVSTHSQDMLMDPGIGLDETLLLIPSHDGTVVRTAATIRQIRLLLENGEALADVVIPYTEPKRNEQLLLFGADGA